MLVYNEYKYFTEKNNRLAEHRFIYFRVSPGKRNGYFNKKSKKKYLLDALSKRFGPMFING